MATVDSKQLIDLLIKNDGYYEDDPRVAQIVEYTNAYGNITWGITYSTESLERQRRYEEVTEYVRNPKVIWKAQ